MLLLSSIKGKLKKRKWEREKEKERERRFRYLIEKNFRPKKEL